MKDVIDLRIELMQHIFELKTLLATLKELEVQIDNKMVEFDLSYKELSDRLNQQMLDLVQTEALLEDI